MSDFIAALPMYDWPEVRAEVDADWIAIRDRLLAAGIDVPEHLVRRNRDMPAVPGGIRDANGLVVAPDPANLPPDELDFATLWRHPRLIFGQTCWGPMELGLAGHVQVIGQPDYSAYLGGAGISYSSAIVMRRDSPPSMETWPEGPEGVGRVRAQRSQIIERGPDDPTPPLGGDPLKGESAPGAAAIPLDLITGKRFAFNSHDSMSGIIALRRDLEAMGQTLDIFAERIESGGHRLSVVAVAEGRADVAAIDCRSWDLARRFEPAAAKLDVIGWTGHRKGLPYITALGSPLRRWPI